MWFLFWPWVNTANFRAMRQIFGFTSREIMQFESKTVWLHETNQKLGIHAKTASQILAPSATVLNIRARRFKMSIVVWILWKFLHFFTDFFSFYIPIFIGLYLDGPLFRLMNVGELKSVISEPVTTAAWTAINELLWFEICVFFFWMWWSQKFATFSKIKFLWA